MQRIRRYVCDVLEIRPKDSLPARCIQCSIMILITLNVAMVIAESVDAVRVKYIHLFRLFETFSVAVFSIEYILRLWSCVEDKRFHHPIIGRLRFALTGMALIDLLAILPFFFPIVFHYTDLRFLRTLRLFRTFRILKIGRYSESLHMLVRVVSSRREELCLSALIVALLLVLSSSVLYLAEHNAQPEHFANIPQAMWWSAVTLTTVGYGDIYPITPVGKLLASLITILGVALFGLPTAILASGFVHEMQNRKSEPQICPHCGKEIHN